MRAQSTRLVHPQPGQSLGGGGDLRRDIRLAVIGGGQQERYQDDVRPGGQRGQDAGQRRDAVVEEGGLDGQARLAGPGTHDRQQVSNRGGRARVLAPVRSRHEWRREIHRCLAGCHACRPHSVLPVPAHRPLRGSAPGATADVHVRQPIDG